MFSVWKKREKYRNKNCHYLCKDADGPRLTGPGSTPTIQLSTDYYSALKIMRFWRETFYVVSLEKKGRNIDTKIAIISVKMQMDPDSQGRGALQPSSSQLIIIQR